MQRVSRTTRIIGERRVPVKEPRDLRAEVFNALNRPNFGLPNTTLFDVTTGQISPTAGRITDTSTRARELQFGLKLSF